MRPTEGTVLFGKWCRCLLCGKIKEAQSFKNNNHIFKSKFSIAVGGTRTLLKTPADLLSRDCPCSKDEGWKDPLGVFFLGEV